MFADVLHYVVGSSAIDVTKVGNAINSDLKLRRIYKQLLGQNRVAFGPREAHAQGEEEIALRNGEGFCIKLKVSKANAKQVYVILTVEQPEQFKSDKAIALHVTSEQTQFRLDFPALVDGKSQSIVASDDERLTALKNINTELSLV